jgi:hypothetical protein
MSTIEKELLLYKNKVLELNTKINELDKLLLKQTEENNNLTIVIHNKDKTIKLLEEKSEEYREILEKAILLKDKLNSEDIKSVIKKDNTNNKNTLDTSFQIDINIDNKQLNKIKYKDVPEDIVKRDINSLKLKDNYQLEYRDEDGYIDITNLCKAGGKKFNDWNRLDKTKNYLNVLSIETGIPVSILFTVGSGSKNITHTWSHPQIAINIAQWISPEFDVLVSKWVYEIMLTGKVDISNQKTTLELDQLNKDNKLLKNRIKLLESKVLQKQPRETFDENKNVIYIITTEYKEAQGYYKIGKAQDLQNRLSVYNTTDKHEVIFNISCKNKKSMDLLEQIVHMKLDDKRIEPNKEWFTSDENAEDFIRIIKECKKAIDL